MKTSEAHIADESLRYFNRWAKRYDRSPAQLWFRANHRLVVEAADPPADARILDLGCGTGQLAARLAARVPRGHVLGVDPAVEMIRVASERAQANLRFVVGSSEAVPADAASFDFAVSTVSFHHWVRPRESLREVARVLAPGGRLLIVDFCRDNPLMSVLDALTARLEPSHSRFASSEEMRAHLFSAGFHDVAVTRPRWFQMLSRGTRGERTTPD